MRNASVMFIDLVNFKLVIVYIFYIISYMHDVNNSL